MTLSQISDNYKQNTPITFTIMVANLLYLALGAYIPSALIFGFLFILGNGKFSNPREGILAIFFLPGVLIAYVAVSFIK